MPRGNMKTLRKAIVFVATAVLISTLLISSPSLASGGAKKEDAPAATTSGPKKLPGGYVHSWTDFPPVVGKTVFGQQPFEYKTKKGIITVVFFVASWCASCQNLADKILAFKKTYDPLGVKTIFVFSHDVGIDAQGFIKEHKWPEEAILAPFELLKDFHNPPLPSVYVSDRQGWLLKRHLNLDHKSLQELDQFIKVLTGF